MVWTVIVGCGLVTIGCRGRAHQDLYQQELQKEVRVLEDELYEADYENRVLIEKLRRARAEAEAATEEARLAAENCRPDVSQNLLRRDPHAVIPLPTPTEPFDLGSDFDEPPIDDAFRKRDSDQATGSGVDPKASEKSIDRDSDPKVSRPSENESDPDFSDIDALIDEGELVPTPEPLVDPQTSGGPSMELPTPAPNQPGQMTLPPAPGNPQPPGPKDLKIDPIEPGIPLPPNTPDGKPDGPPGQIELPKNLGMLGGLGRVAGSTSSLELRPAKIQIDATQCRVIPVATPAAADAESTEPSSTPVDPSGGIDLIVRALDAYGHPISVLGDTHDPTSSLASAGTAKTKPLPGSIATLSVVVLDASQQGEAAKLGRWDFPASQLRELEQIADPGKSVRLPIRWQSKQPTGESVIVFARLQDGPRDLRCDAEIGLKKQPSVAGWLPRR